MIKVSESDRYSSACLKATDKTIMQAPPKKHPKHSYKHTFVVKNKLNRTKCPYFLHLTLKQASLCKFIFYTSTDHVDS